MFNRRTAGSAALSLGAVGLLAWLLVSGSGLSPIAPRVLSAASAASPARASSTAVAPLDVPILMYHYVDTTPPDAGPAAARLTISPAQFAAEMDYLTEHGCHPVTISELYAALTGAGRLPARPVAITFDDGGLDNYTVALPILLDHGFRATFFVITGCVGNRVCMSWDQLRKMRAAGMEIESHTVAHPDLRKVGPERLRMELQQARATLAEELGIESRFLSYPQGRYNKTVVAAARAAGYVAAVRTRSFWGPWASGSDYAWQRTNIKPGMSLAAFGRVVADAARVVVR